MKIVGIDVNTKYLAISMLGDEGFAASYILPHEHKKEQRGLHAFDRLKQINRAFQSWVRPLGVTALNQKAFIDYVYIEDVPSVRNTQTLKDLHAVVTAVRLALVDAGVAHGLVNNTVWKKETIGNGKADKAEIRQWALAHIPGLPDDLTEDEYDASVIAWRGLVASGCLINR